MFVNTVMISIYCGGAILLSKGAGVLLYCQFVNQKMRFNRIIFIMLFIVWKLFTLAFLTK
jgi:hypothetical protein